MRATHIFSTVLLSLSAAHTGASDLTVSQLRCEYLNDPLGINVTEPRLSWVLDSPIRGQRQTAYRILVASSPQKLSPDQADLWDSSKVESDRSIHVVYAGKPLTSQMRCYWKVCVWDKDGKATDWSESASWSMGLLHRSDWQARWIGPPPEAPPRNAKDPPIPPCPLLRRSFRVTTDVRSAMLYATALGCYELRINGRPVGDRVLAPEWTDYPKRLQYQTYDVTELIKKGDNAVAATLADGWYLGRLGLVDLDPNFPRRAYYGKNRRLLAQLVITTRDGSRQRVCSDGSWKIHEDGPIRSADLFLGETIDARKEIPGWDEPDFDDSSWPNAVVDDSLHLNLAAQMNEPIRVVKELTPIGVSQPRPDVYVFDMGRNMVGRCRIRLGGAEGALVTLRHAEMLDPDSTVYVENLRSADQVDRFILAGAPERQFEPTFTYHGFRYVQVEGLSKKPDLDMIAGSVIASDSPPAGTFECSNPLLNRLWQNIVWTQRGNMHSTPTDCPQRSERMGWMGDAQIFSQTAIFNMDMAAFYTKWIGDIRDGQAADGRFPDFAPHIEAPRNTFYNAPGWADAGVIVPWRMYVNYADRRALEAHYDAAKRYVDNIRSKNPNLIWAHETGNNYSDWLNGNTLKIDDYPRSGAAAPKDLFATAYFFHSTHLLSQIATVLGRSDDADDYRTLASRIKAAFNKQFVSHDGKLEGDNQSGYALALCFGLLAESKRSMAAEHLVAAIRRYDDRLSTGIQPTGRLMLELARTGRSDLAYRLLESRRCPSWLYMVEQGSTTVWERWDGYVQGRGFQDPGMNSFNHFALGAVGEWMVKTILGIAPDETHPGYERIVVAPQPGGSLRWARGSYRSIRGPIRVGWRYESDALHLVVSIPPNSAATVYLPAEDPADVTESGEPLQQAHGVRLIKTHANRTAVLIESGQYEFTING